MNPRVIRLLCLGLFLLTLAGQWWFAQRFAVEIEDEPDGKIYLELAHHLIADGTYSLDTDDAGPAPTYLRLPGYPWMLAGLFKVSGDGNQAAVRGFQALLATLTCAGVAWLAFLWEPDPERRRRAALVAFGLAAVCPFTAIYTATILSEMLTLFLVVLLTLAATSAFRVSSWRAATLRWVMAGLVAGAVQLVRPEAGLFAAAVGFTLTGFGLFGPGEERWPARLPGVLRNGAAFSLAFVLMLVPWTVRNARVFHVFAPLPPVNANLPGEMDYHGFRAWYRTWADSERSLEPYYWDMTDGEPATMDQLPARAFDSDEERARTAALFARYNAPATPHDAKPPHADPPGDAEQDAAESPDADSPDTAKSPDNNKSPDDAKPDDAKPDDDDSPDDAEARVTGITTELDEAFGQVARERVARHPWRHVVELPLRRAVNLWFGPHATYYDFDGPLFPWRDIKPGFAPHFWLPVFFTLVCAYTALGLAGLWRLAKARKAARVEAWRWLVLVILVGLPRWIYLATLENTEPRYTVEFFPFLCVLGGLALARGRTAASPAPVDRENRSRYAASNESS